MYNALSEDSSSSDTVIKDDSTTDTTPGGYEPFLCTYNAVLTTVDVLKMPASMFSSKTNISLAITKEIIKAHHSGKRMVDVSPSDVVFPDDWLRLQRLGFFTARRPLYCGLWHPLTIEWQRFLPYNRGRGSNIRVAEYILEGSYDYD